LPKTVDFEEKPKPQHLCIVRKAQEKTFSAASVGMPGRMPQATAGVLHRIS
jgi:hypothetical protein